MYIKRSLEAELLEKFTSDNKVVVLFGARQVGKTTLLRRLVQKCFSKVLFINGDEHKYADVLSSRDFDRMKLLVAGYECIFIDEAQRIPEIGLNLKILTDNLPELKIVASGSSSFELASKVKEPLTGRKWTYNLFPISVRELAAGCNLFELDQRLDEFLIFGMYPEVFAYENMNDKISYLRMLSESYLYKDIFELSSIRYPRKIFDLLRLLAFQIGNEVSLSEIGKKIGMSKESVESYIDLLEKSYVVFRLSGFSRNLRKEITKMDKIFFYDLGVRNAIIDNFKEMNFRDDYGALWENFLITERMKWRGYFERSRQSYFWRVYTGAEIDYVEADSDGLTGYEMKLKKDRKKAPKSWVAAYPDADYCCINRDNYLKFIFGEI